MIWLEVIFIMYTISLYEGYSFLFIINLGLQMRKHLDTCNKYSDIKGDNNE